jgi:diaminopimelate decarboxylase
MEVRSELPATHVRLPYIDPTSYTPCFSYRHGALHCERVALEKIAARAGTPVYVTSGASVERAYRRFDAAFAAIPHQLCYAVKANSNLSLLRRFARLGSAFDIVSGGELYRVRRVGVPGRRIVFSGVGKTREEIREALREKILLFNVESEAELELLAGEAARTGRRASTGLRINPDVEAGGHPHISTGMRSHKFGVDPGDARRIYLAHRDSPAIRWQGISAHIGSQILDVAPFRRAAALLAELAKEISRSGILLRYVDLGGGLGIRYAQEQPPDLAFYAREIVRAIRPLGCRLLLEPGRALVGPAGVLLTRVLYSKRNRGRTFVVVDAGMNDFQRPALYGARHPITAVVRHSARHGRLLSRQRVDVVGPVCESGDTFAQDVLLERVEVGDLLVLWGAGAYGSVAASNYNSRARPAEVMVEGSRFHVTRRRESRADLIRGE